MKKTLLVRRFIITICFSFNFITFNALIAQSLPLIFNVSGDVQEGQSININGLFFDSKGPNIVLFDDFSRGTVGDSVSLNATVGKWDSRNAIYTPTYNVDTAGNMAGYLIKKDRMHQLRLSFNGAQEVYISYRVMIPPGKHFPNSYAPNTFPAGSQWKLTWLMDESKGYLGNDDVCLPTWGNGVYFNLAGNDNAFQNEVGRPGTSTNWFSFSGWNRFSAYLKAGANPEIDNGIIWAQGISNEFGQKQFFGSKVLFDGNDNPVDDTISEWDHFYVPAWHREGDSAVNVMYDDIYVATGEAAAARVEIGDKNDYSSCTKLVLATPTSWNSNSIDATIHTGGVFKACDTAYIYVTNKDNLVNLSGFPVIINKSSCIATMVESDIEKLKITVYPNPTEGLLMISGLEARTNIILENILGAQITEMTTGIKNDTQVLDIQYLPEGIYFLKFKTIDKEGNAKEFKTVKILRIQH